MSISMYCGHGIGRPDWNIDSLGSICQPSHRFIGALWNGDTSRCYTKTTFLTCKSKAMLLLLVLVSFWEKVGLQFLCDGREEFRENFGSKTWAEKVDTPCFPEGKVLDFEFKMCGNPIFGVLIVDRLKNNFRLKGYFQSIQHIPDLPVIFQDIKTSRSHLTVCSSPAVQHTYQNSMTL